MVKGFLVFMDHSITEQLTGVSSAWHTTAIALSEGGEVSELARSISRNVFPDRPRLQKWSAGHKARKRRYRVAFARELCFQLPDSSVYLFATSATEATIITTREQALQELQISHLCEEESRESGSAWMRVGPFTSRETGDDHFFDFPLNRALMIFWISHFVVRMHQMFHNRLQATQNKPLVLDWFFYLDKFAGDTPTSSSATKLFQAIVSGNINNGNVTSSFF